MHVFMDDCRNGPFNSDWLGSKAVTIGEDHNKENWQDWVIVRSVENCKMLLKLGGIIEDLSLDHDMGDQETGMDLVKWMCKTGHFPSGKITIHSANFDAASQMQSYLDNFKSIKELK
jgi:hypothetical protein